MVVQENALLWDLLDKVWYQMSWDFALLKLMEQENEQLWQCLSHKTQKPKKKKTNIYT